MQLIYVFSLVIVGIGNEVLAEMFSSIEHLRYLHEKEANVISEYRLLLQNVKHFSTELEKYLNQYLCRTISLISDFFCLENLN